MSKKPNTTLIGAFVLAGSTLVVMGILFFGSGRFLRDTDQFILYFDGSVNGLNVGAPVKFKGVQIGVVTRIGLELQLRDIEFLTPVFIETTKNIVRGIGDLQDVPPDLKDLRSKGDQMEILRFLVRRGLRAQLQLQSLLTGQLFIDLDMHPGTPLRLVMGHPEVPEIPTIPSQFEELTRTLMTLPLKKLVAEFLRTLESINRRVNAPEIDESLKNLNDTLREAKNLVRHTDEKILSSAAGLEDTLKEARDALGEAKGMFSRVGDAATVVGSSVRETSLDARETLKKAQRFIDQMERQVDRVAEGLEGTLKGVDRHTGSVAAGLLDTLRDMRTTLAHADRTLITIHQAVDERSPLRADLSEALRELAAAARSFRIFADYIEQHPEALLRGKGPAGER